MTIHNLNEDDFPDPIPGQAGQTAVIQTMNKDRADQPPFHNVNMDDLWNLLESSYKSIHNDHADPIHNGNKDKLRNLLESCYEAGQTNVDSIHNGNKDNLRTESSKCPNFDVGKCPNLS